MTDIEHGWQAREAALRKLVRECKHNAERLTNSAGQLFCASCGMHLGANALWNLIVDWIAYSWRPETQPPDTIHGEILGLLADFERMVRREAKGEA